MGWVMASARQLRGHQFGNVVLSRFPITSPRQHDLSWKTCEERCLQRVGHRRRRAARCTSTTSTSARRFSSAATRRSASPTIVSRPPRRAARRSCSAISTSGCAARPRELLSARLKSVDLRDYLEAPAHLSGPVPDSAPRSHLRTPAAMDPIVGHRPAAHAALARRLGSPATSRGYRALDSRRRCSRRRARSRRSRC